MSPLSPTSPSNNPRQQISSPSDIHIIQIEALVHRLNQLTLINSEAINDEQRAQLSVSPSPGQGMYLSSNIE